MSTYVGEFKSINNKDYKITITTSSGAKNETVLLADPPLQITGSDPDHIYEPVKTTGATVSLLTKTLPLDIYSGSVLGTKVEVTSGQTVIWTGYLTPCAYSQGYDLPFEQLDLECVCGLSVLKDIPYTSSDKEIKSFISIIFNCLKKSNCFKTLYISNVLQFSSSGNDSITEKIRVSEGNFYEEKDYELQPDNEVAMSCYDVLFEVCQYIGMTIVAQGNEVYILDYDAIRTGKNSYWKYDISGAAIGTRQAVTLANSYQIKDGSFAESGTQVELDEVFNKLTVKDDFYKIESVNDGMNDGKNYINITAANDDALKAEIGKHNEGPYIYVDVVNVPNGSNGNERMELCTFRSLTSGDDRGWYHFNIFKFFKNPFIQTYHYRMNDNAKLTGGFFDTAMNYSNMWTSKGANVVGNFNAVFDAWEYLLSGWASNYPKDKWARMTDKEKLDAYAEILKIRNVESKKLTNYIICNNPSEAHISHDKVKNYPYFTIKKNVPSVFGGINSYIVISGSLIRHSWDNCLFPHYSGVTNEIKEQNCSVYKNEMYLWARLKWGNKYWKEEGNEPSLKGEWVSSPAYFKLYYGDPTKETKLKEWYNTELDFYNTCKFIWGETGESGYYIPAPESDNLAGEIELTFYANKDTKGKWDRRGGKKDKNNSYSGYPPKTILYKDIDIKLCFADDALNEDAASEDTYYTNEVEDYLNINEADGVECKICTFDNKTPSYSTVDYLDGSTSRYVDTIYSLVYNMALRMEEHIVYKRVNQHREPRLKYNANLKYDIGLKPYSTLTEKTISGKTFIVDSMTIDLKYNKMEVKLVEKSNSYS